MNRQHHHARAAALALVLCLSVSPVLEAKVLRDRDYDGGISERIVRTIKTVQKFFSGLSSNNDTLTPPRP